MLVMEDTRVREQFLHPPAKLLTERKDPQSGKPGFAFPLQTVAWLKMQDIVRTALSFPLSRDSFKELYGTFTDQATVEGAVAILGTINRTAAEYGDPLTLISELPTFQKADEAPASIYGNAVWLASRTQLTAQQIRSLLDVGLTDIGTAPDARTRIAELTELLTGQGGVGPLATALKSDIDAFEKKTTGFYATLNAQLTGPSNSLESYLKSSGNVLAEAQQIVSDDLQMIEDLTKSIKMLNEEYIGFTTAASVSPLFLLVPLVGPFLAVPDAITFAVLASKVKKQLDAARKTLAARKEDEQKKSALVTQLTGFNGAAATVEDDGKAFLDTIAALSSGWTEFAGQIDLRLQSLTVDDVKDWSAFLTRIGFRTALDGWQLIEQKAEAFYQTGFVQFSKDTSGS